MLSNRCLYGITTLNVGPLMAAPGVCAVDGRRS
jgi:hypothetical protein